MDKKLKKQLNLTFSAPEPVKKNSFLKKLRPREITTSALLIQQVPYIKKLVWLFALAILIVAVAGAATMNENTERIIVALAPLAALIAILEMHRSCRYQMIEFEFATRFSLKSVLYARMLIIGLVYAAVFCIIAPVISLQFGIGVAAISFRILIPYLFTISLCLYLERTKVGRANGYLSSAVASIIAVGIVWMSSYELESIDNFIAQWGLVILILMTILAVYENYKTIRMTEDFAWK